MPKLNDLSGLTFGRLAVERRAGTSANGKALWLCHCTCGNCISAVGTDLRSGHTTSCGCRRAERNRTSSLSHGMSSTPTHRTWQSMWTRCTNQNVKSYADYGAKGVRVCDRWRDFAAFLADMGRRPDGKTLDRYPDHMGKYEPGNCRWATKVEQQRNTSANSIIEHDGRRLTQAEWVERTGIKQGTISYRIRSGWTPAEALCLTPHLGLKRKPPQRRADGTFGEDET